MIMLSILVLLAWLCDISLLCRLFTVMQEGLSMKVCMLRIIFVDIAPEGFQDCPLHIVALPPSKRNNKYY